MDIREVTMNVLTGGQSHSVAISSTSAQSNALGTAVANPGGLDAVVTPSVDCFVRQGANPTALSDGTDQFLVAGNSYRLSGIVGGNKLAFKTTAASGTVYITPGA